MINCFMIIGNYTFHILLERRRQLEVSQRRKTAKRSKIKISSWSVFDLAFSDFGQKEIKDCKCFSVPSHFSSTVRINGHQNYNSIWKMVFVFFLEFLLIRSQICGFEVFFFESFVSHFLMDSSELLGKIRSI